MALRIFLLLPSGLDAAPVSRKVRAGEENTREKNKKNVLFTEGAAGASARHKDAGASSLQPLTLTWTLQSA